MSVVLLLGVQLGATPALADPGPTPLAAQSTLIPSPTLLQFGAVGIHFGGSPQQSVTLSNESSSAVTVMSSSVNGPDSSRFQIVNSGCTGRTIEPGNSCTVEIQFQPGGRGEDSATLDVELLAGGGGPVEVPLTGIGSTGTLAANPSSLDFSAIPYAQGDHEENQSETEQVNVESQGYGSQIESVSIAGPDASSFSVQYGNCESNQLGSNNSCDEGVRFQPVSPGPKQAELVIKGDSPNSPLVIPLTGEGLLGPTVSVSSSEALLGNVPIGSSTWHTFTVTNSGDYPLFIQQSFLVSGTPAMFPLLSNTCSAQIIVPGASCEFTVGFDPATPGEKDASIVFITNATPQIKVLGIDGVGVQAVTEPATPSPAGAPAVTSILTSPLALESDGVADAGLLRYKRASRVYGPAGKQSVNAGIDAQCPATVRVCRAESFVVTRVPSHPSSPTSQGTPHTAVLLGSALSRLRGGEDVAVQVPLSNGAIALLNQRGRLHATIVILVRAAGVVIAARDQTVTLTA